MNKNKTNRIKLKLKLSIRYYCCFDHAKQDNNFVYIVKNDFKIEKYRTKILLSEA